MKEFIVYNSSVKESELKELNIFISNNSVVQDNVIIYFNSCIMGDSIIYSGSVLHNNCVIENSVIRTNCQIYSSRIENSEIGQNCTIGPFAVVKDNCEIGDNNRIGNFSEIKNSVLSNNISVASLCSILNAEIGCDCKIGSGTIFCATDDNKICIGDKVLIGENSSLIAPLTIADESRVETGSSITKDIDFKNLASSKNKQVNTPIK